MIKAKLVKKAKNKNKNNKKVNREPQKKQHKLHWRLLKRPPAIKKPFTRTETISPKPLSSHAPISSQAGPICGGRRRRRCSSNSSSSSIFFLRFDLPDKRMSCPSSCLSVCPIVCLSIVRSSVCSPICPLSVVHLNVRFTRTVRSLKDCRSKPPIVTRVHRAIADVLKSFSGVTCRGVKSCLKVTCHDV